MVYMLKVFLFLKQTVNLGTTLLDIQIGALTGQLDNFPGKEVLAHFLRKVPNPNASEII